MNINVHPDPLMLPAIPPERRGIEGKRLGAADDRRFKASRWDSLARGTWRRSVREAVLVAKPGL